MPQMQTDVFRHQAPMIHPSLCSSRLHGSRRARLGELPDLSGADVVSADFETAPAPEADAIDARQSYHFGQGQPGRTIHDDEQDRLAARDVVIGDV